MARILLVDHDHDSRTVLAALLQGAGHAVVYAREPEDALALVYTGGIDLVVTDLPEWDVHGPRLIREITERANTPVIALAGDNRAHEILAREYGAFEAIPKPIDPRDLLDAVDRADGRMVFAWDGVWH